MKYCGGLILSMGSRRENLRSVDKEKFKYVVIDGLKSQFSCDANIRSWLERYGHIRGKNQFSHIFPMYLFSYSWQLYFCNGVMIFFLKKFVESFSNFLILGIKRSRGMVIVKFSTEAEAAQAVKCENGIRRYGSHIKIHHPDSELMRRLGLTPRQWRESATLGNRRSPSSGSGSSGRRSRM